MNGDLDFNLDNFAILYFGGIEQCFSLIIAAYILTKIDLVFPDVFVESKFVDDYSKDRQPFWGFCFNMM